jgi:poly(3-hydroxybutyrate) depolymerase
MWRVAFLVLALSWSQPLAAAPAKLPRLGADPAKVSVSGLSSGGFMAVQYDVAFSASVMGAGVVAGGPYDCDYLMFGDVNACMDGAPSGSASYDMARYLANWGAIDPVSHLQTQKIYLFSGLNDTTVGRKAVDATFDFFKAAGTPAASIQYVKDVPAGHAFLSPNPAADCGVTASPYVNQCQVAGAPYDQPGAILAQIYGPLQPKRAAQAQPVAFDQREFTPYIHLSGLADTGYVYIPTDCANGGKCAVHVVFHGCKQDAGAVQDAVYKQLGYNDWADANKIIVLYPQVASGDALNPYECWDWFGYTGFDFPIRSGVQLSAVNAMVQRLLAAP